MADDRAEVNAARPALLLDSGAWPDDLPRLVRGALALQRAGRWGTTTANAWGILAVERFAAAFEAVAPTGTTTAVLGGQREALAWAKDPAGAALDLAWPAAAADLTVEQAGTGAPWVTVETRAAVPLRQPLEANTGDAARGTAPGDGRAGDVASGRPAARAARDRGAGDVGSRRRPGCAGRVAPPLRLVTTADGGRHPDDADTLSPDFV